MFLSFVLPICFVLTARSDEVSNKGDLLCSDAVSGAELVPELLVIVYERIIKRWLV